jgi:hypothetical protein
MPVSPGYSHEANAPRDEDVATTQAIPLAHNRQYEWSVTPFNAAYMCRYGRLFRRLGRGGCGNRREHVLGILGEETAAEPGLDDLLQLT